MLFLTEESHEYFYFDCIDVHDVYYYTTTTIRFFEEPLHTHTPHTRRIIIIFLQKLQKHKMKVVGNLMKVSISIFDGLRFNGKYEKKVTSAAAAIVYI